MEQQLIERCVAGDQFAFQQLYKKYDRRVWRICFGFVKNPVEADDLAQDVALKAWKHVKGCAFESENKFFAWLGRIARNTCINEIRTHKGRKEEELFEDAICSDKRLSPDAQVGSVEIVGHLNEVLGGLSPDKDRILRLVAEEHKYKEIAEIEGIALGTVMSRLFRARQDLKKVMDGKTIRQIEEGDTVRSGGSRTHGLSTDCRLDTMLFVEGGAKRLCSGVEKESEGEMDKVLFQSNATSVIRYYWFRTGLDSGFTAAGVKSDLGDGLNYNTTSLLSEMKSEGLLVEIGEDHHGSRKYAINHKNRKVEHIAIVGGFLPGLDKMDELVEKFVAVLPKIQGALLRVDPKAAPIGRRSLVSRLRLQLDLDDAVHDRVIADAFDKATIESPGHFSGLNRGKDGEVHSYIVCKGGGSPPPDPDPDPDPPDTGSSDPPPPPDSDYEPAPAGPDDGVKYSVLARDARVRGWIIRFIRARFAEASFRSVDLAEALKAVPRWRTASGRGIFRLLVPLMDLRVLDHNGKKGNSSRYRLSRHQESPPSGTPSDADEIPPPTDDPAGDELFPVQVVPSSGAAGEGKRRPILTVPDYDLGQLETAYANLREFSNSLAVGEGRPQDWERSLADHVENAVRHILTAEQLLVRHRVFWQGGEIEEEPK